MTVVIPMRNRRDLLLRTLESVARQEEVELEVVVVVDDGGTDGTADELRRLGWTNLRVLRHEQSKGVSAARNAGLGVATTPWVAFVDDDDLWAPDKLRALLAAVRDQPPARWACGGAVRVDAGLDFLRYAVPPASGQVAAELSRRNAIPGGGSGIVVDRLLAHEVGGFDEQMSILADWDFNVRLARRSPVAVVSRPLVGYYVHSDSMFHDSRGLQAEMRYMERKYAAHPGAGVGAIDWAAASERLLRMAYYLGDRRTALRLVLRAVFIPGSASVAARGAARVLERLVRRRLKLSPVPAHGDELFDREQVESWLAAYRSPRPAGLV
ncbi:Glycosyl transferase family 2 [Modestobacter sp. DSM 44400]|nr:Glycosyl transferase family 2 [Modestobacter sp. DSM 44400]